MADLTLEDLARLRSTTPNAESLRKRPNTWVQVSELPALLDLAEEALLLRKAFGNVPGTLKVFKSDHLPANTITVPTYLYDRIVALFPAADVGGDDVE